MERRQITIVVAEDEVLIRMNAVDFLTEAGFEVIEAGHADEALTILGDQAADIHLLFTDVHMPGTMNGLELAHHARAHWPWIALLVVSGHAKPNTEELPEGSRFLTKPYDLDQVIGHVRELVAA
jgi:CheY-like chemotaxis protein